MATAPAFISTPRIATATISTANTNRDGTGTITSIMTGVAAGTRVLEVVAQAAVSGAITAGLVTVFISTDSGTTWRLHDEIAIAGVTSSASVKASRNSATYSNLILSGTTDRIGVATTIAQAIAVSVLGGDLT
jgi:hypothetical protein